MRQERKKPHLFHLERPSLNDLTILYTLPHGIQMMTRMMAWQEKVEPQVGCQSNDQPEFYPIIIISTFANTVGGNNSL